MNVTTSSTGGITVAITPAPSGGVMYVSPSTQRPYGARPSGVSEPRRTVRAMHCVHYLRTSSEPVGMTPVVTAEVRHRDRRDLRRDGLHGARSRGVASTRAAVGCAVVVRAADDGQT